MICKKRGEEEVVERILVALGIAIVSFIIVTTIIYAIITYKVFINIFKRKKCYSLLDLDLSNTHYAKHLDKIKENIEELKNRPCEVVSIKNDGLALKARYYNNNSKNTIIMAHGYHAQAFNNFHASFKSFYSHGYNVLMTDERAHNDSEGEYTTVGLKEQYDLLEWIKWVEDNTNTKSIVLYGVSMGATTVGYVSNKLDNTKVKAIILDCGFTSFYDEIFYKEKSKGFLFLIIFFLRLYAKMILHIDIKKSTLDTLKETKTPAYFIHGIDDEMVPVEHTIAAYNATISDKKVHYVLGCGHTTAFLIDYDYLDKDVFNFLDKYTNS